MTEKERTLLLKIQQLAESGVGGEKENAKHLLQKTMNRLGITAEDLESKKIVSRYFKIQKQRVQLFVQVAGSVMNDERRCYKSKNRRGFVWCEITNEEAIEIEAKYDFYLRALKEEEEVFLEAFIMKHNLYNSSQESVSRNLSKERKAKIIKASLMAGGMSDRSFYKQIEN